MLLAQKTLHRTASMARFRTTERNAAAFAAMRRLLDGHGSVLWLHGGRKTGKGYSLSALHRSFLASAPRPPHRHLYLDGAHLRFVYTGLFRDGWPAVEGLLDHLTLAPTLLLDDVEEFLSHVGRQVSLGDVLLRRSTWGRPTVLTSRTHPLALELNRTLRSLTLERTFGLGPLSRTDRRAIVQHEAGRHIVPVPAGVCSFLARAAGETEDQLRRTTRRVLLAARAASYPVTLPLAKQIVAR